MSTVRYDSWARHYADLLAAFGVKQGKVCECACGTGNLTLPLQRLGYQMTGIDLSQEMLWLAAQKARQAGLGIPFVKQDMRKLRLHRPMDAILSTCDGVNYLLKDSDVLAFFTSAYEALRPGGVLIFDVSTPWKLRNQLGNQLICDDGERITYLWQNSYSEKNGTVDMHLCIFVKQSDGTYRRIDEEQTQRAHSAEVLKAMLTEAGFGRVMVFGGNRTDVPRENDTRWHIAAVKQIEGQE